MSQLFLLSSADPASTRRIAFRLEQQDQYPMLYVHQQSIPALDVEPLAGDPGHHNLVTLLALTVTRSDIVHPSSAN